MRSHQTSSLSHTDSTITYRPKSFPIMLPMYTEIVATFFILTKSKNLAKNKIEFNSCGKDPTIK